MLHQGLVLIELFKEKTIELEKKIKNLHRVQKIIETKISLTEKAICMDDSQITLKLQEEEQLFLSESILNSSDAEFLKATSDFIDFCNENEFYTGFPIGTMISKENIIEGNHDDYSFLYTKVMEKQPASTFYSKPKGLYVVAYHKGSYKNISETYERILQFMKSENLNLKSFAYEEYILDEVAVKGYENYLTQIMVEVEWEWGRGLKYANESFQAMSLALKKLTHDEHTDSFLNGRFLLFSLLTDC